jgi:hypothetical protein
MKRAMRGITLFSPTDGRMPTVSVPWGRVPRGPMRLSTSRKLAAIWRDTS